MGMFLCRQIFGWTGYFLLFLMLKDVRGCRELSGWRIGRFFCIHALDQNFWCFFLVLFLAKDLILWEFLRIPSFPSCRVNLALECGQEIGMHVPNICRNMAPPAIFWASVGQPMAVPRPGDSSDTNQTGAFLVKFFDDGYCFMEGPGAFLAP